MTLPARRATSSALIGPKPDIADGSLKSHPFSTSPTKSLIVGSEVQARRSAARVKSGGTSRCRKAVMSVSAPIEFERRQLRDIAWRIVLRVAVFAGLGKRIVLARALGIAELAPGMRILPRRRRAVCQLARRPTRQKIFALAIFGLTHGFRLWPSGKRRAMPSGSARSRSRL